MTGNTLGWVIVAFVLYLLMMIAIGAFYAKGNNNSEDYFLGGRKLNGFVAALSAQASDMSGWLLMGLPGAIYLTGVGGDGWIAIGLFIGCKYAVKYRRPMLTLLMPYVFANVHLSYGYGYLRGIYKILANKKFNVESNR